MKVFITGDLGFIGTHLKDILSKCGIEYVTFDKKRKKSENILNLKSLVRKMWGCDVVVHLAAVISVEDSQIFATEYYLNNIVGTSKVLQAAQMLGIKKIVFASSAAVFEPYTSPYALSKVAGEGVFECGKRDISIFCLRFFNIYGEGQSPEYAGVISKFIEIAKDKKTERPMIIFGDGSQTRDFIHVSDVCRSIIASLNSDLKGFFRFQIGTGKPTSIKELAYLIKGITGSQAEIEYIKERGVGIKHSSAEINGPKELLKFETTTNIVDGLTNLLKTTELPGSRPKRKRK